jgi:vacuolar-type H+-ATPase subunit E/Vma4
VRFNARGKKGKDGEMSFEKLEAAVIAEAEAEAAKIVDSARSETGTLLARSREEGERTFGEAARQAEAAAARETARQLGLARHEGRLEVLTAKNRVIDEVFRMAAERVNSLSDAEYLDLMAEWLKNLPVEIGGTLRVSPRDEKRFTEAFLGRVNAGRAENGRFHGVVADSRITGGFVVTGDTFTVDSTLDNRMNELRESLAGELARELFGL